MGAKEVCLQGSHPPETLLAKVALEPGLLMYTQMVLQRVLGAALLGTDLADEFLKNRNYISEVSSVRRIYLTHLNFIKMVHLHVLPERERPLELLPAKITGYTKLDVGLGEVQLFFAEARKHQITRVVPGTKSQFSCAMSPPMECQHFAMLTCTP